ncbi:MAG: hypothetical protein DRI44_01965 [Chlamydiae bacterium]|nr:MAG: hypothetical protein DRI44_01965 [Chlamydiota bacterium]
MKHTKNWYLHLSILAFASLTLLPFYFVINNSFRSNTEMYHSFFGFPKTLEQLIVCSYKTIKGEKGTIVVNDEQEQISKTLTYKDAVKFYFDSVTRNYKSAWKVLRPYFLNTFLVVIATAFGVLVFGSVTAYILSRFKFPGNKVIFYYFISTMMFPAVLTLVPSFLLVKRLGLLNSRLALIIPAIAGGQVFAIFVFKSFFDGLPQDLFDSAKIDGAGHFSLYWNLILPLSKPVLSVVLIMNILGMWNSFLWPYIVNTDKKYHVIASGLFVLSQTEAAANFGLLYAAYITSSIPLLILFIYATKTFIQGMTSGAFKA